MPFLAIGLGLVGFALGWWLKRCPPCEAPAMPIPEVGDTQLADAPSGSVIVKNPASPGSSSSNPPWPVSMVGAKLPPAPYVE